MIDLRFSTHDVLKTVDCQKCPEVVKRQRKCKEDGFNNIPRGRQIDPSSLKLTFCHGKATWYNEIADLFSDCLMSLETGVLPKPGSIEDQDEIFAENFSWFVNYFRLKENSAMWRGSYELAGNVLESLGKMISKMFGGK